MGTDYRRNHYVPEWYQKNFIPPDGSGKLFYLRLKPKEFRDSKGGIHLEPALRESSPGQCFYQKDLYTTRFGANVSRDIERYFFGLMDTNGQKAANHFANYVFPNWDGKPVQDLITYLSTQKLRTPKGLDWLANTLGTTDGNRTLIEMQRFQDVFCATWVECVWQIADAESSDTKFIISDHPVTIYNRECGPRNKKWCRGSNDPDIRLQGSHTVFPLSLNKVLILTNMSWVRNPYQSAVGERPNPTLYHSTVFDFHRLQINRRLSEQEVREINFVIKSRAYDYIAAGKEEWLYPEKFITKSNWNVYGDGLLFMPDPRSFNYGGEVYGGNNSGPTFAVDSYGRKPGDPNFGKEDIPPNQSTLPLYRFQGDFARKFGTHRRGVAMEFGELEDEVDTETYHEYHLGLGKQKKSKNII